MSTVMVFVYGSLLPGQAGYRLVEPHLIHRRPGSVKGKLYAAEYARFVPGETGCVAGEWYMLDDCVLPVLDEYENFLGPGNPGNEYERILIDDAENPVKGYVYARQSPAAEDVLIESGSWIRYLSDRKIVE